MGSFTDPLLFAGVIIVVGFIGARYWQRRSLPAYYLMRVAFFVLLTGLLLKGAVVPYRPRASSGSELSQLFVVVLEITWWLGAAWVAVGFFRAFIVWGRQP